MFYLKKEPNSKLSRYIKNFWLIDSELDTSIRIEKIIPDGYPELIFHYGDVYKSNIDGSWKVQTNDLLAGQIKNYFFLQNTGVSRMFAIKFQPWALKLLFNVDMSLHQNEVRPLSREILNIIEPVRDIAKSQDSFDRKVSSIEDWFIEFISKQKLRIQKGELGVQWILEKNGNLTIQDTLEKINVSERSFERYFNTFIGLSPKFYCRIIRFSHIFNLTQNKDFNWSDISYLAGYYDQSHFIKNFKEFTGEDPSKYGFSDENMANFFLKDGK